MKTINHIKVPLLALILVGVLLLPGAGAISKVAHAETTSGTSGHSQGGQAAEEGAEQASSSSGSTGDIASDAASCLVSDLLASILTEAIYSIIAVALSNIGIPATVVKTQDTTNEVKTYGVTIAGTYVPLLPSLDALAYCLLNSIISYIADATIEWINSGFEGSPMFVNDTQGFFQSVVDYELNNFMQELQDGLLCEPITLDLQLALMKQAMRNGARDSRCGAGGASAINNLQTGRYSSADANKVLLNSGSNPLTSYYNTTDSATLRLRGKRNLIQLEVDWGRGWLGVPDPENPNRRISLGTVTEQTVARRLGFAEDRLILAEKFDQVITALVNQLVKIAINELFEETGVQVNVHEVDYEAYRRYLEREQTQRPFLQGSGQR